MSRALSNVGSVNLVREYLRAEILRAHEQLSSDQWQAILVGVSDQGEIVAQGDHASLYAGNALYKSLYDRQMGSS